MIGAVRRSIREPERSEQKTHRGCGNEAAAEDYMEESGQTRAARILPDFSDYEEAKALGILDEMLEGKKSIVILGHVNPDGDCIGSCLGLYNYLKENYEGLEVSVYLEKMGVKFSYLSGYNDVHTEYDGTKTFDLCITSDASDVPRLGAFAPYRETAKDTFCIDHHITNKGLCRVNVIESGASSASEVLFGLLDQDKISKAVAECLYTGIAHDTGVFKYSNTSRKTMDIAGFLMEKGIDFPKIIDESFFAKTYGQAKLHGRALLDSVRILDDRCIYTVVTTDELKEYGCTVKATDGIVDQLRVIEGAEVVFLLYETGNPDEYKVSLRTNSEVDVSRIAQSFGGGGHVKAAGCTMTGKPEEIAEKIHVHIKSHGSQLAPMDCWLLPRGIKTLPVRMDRHNENAKKVAEWLRTQPKVKKVYYVGFEDHKDYATTIKQTRGFGGMISFTVDSFETVQKILRNVDMIMFAESLGGTETLITYPTTQTHEDTPKDVKEKLGITDRFLRMSVGIENVEDIIADLDRAMNS